MVAPTDLVFYDARWEEIGTKTSLAQIVAGITGVDKSVLADGLQAHDLSVAEKDVVGCRKTNAPGGGSCLLTAGAICVHMPPIYGEGARARSSDYNER